MTPTRLEPRKVKSSACTEALLDISTGHIRADTREWINYDLMNAQGIVLGTKWSEYGWILWISPDALYHDEASMDFGSVVMPDDLRQVMGFAQQHGYRYLKLDCDACYVEGLPIYDNE